MVGFRLTRAMLKRIFMSVMWHGIFITLWLIYHDSNANILSLHYIFGGFVVVDWICIYFTNKFFRKDINQKEMDS